MHLEAIPKKNREVFSALSSFDNFYLAGGTALALQLGHRISADFDLFTNTEIAKDLLPKVQNLFKGFKIVASVNNSEELTVFAKSTKLTFLKYPFPLIFDLIEYRGIKLLSVKEIAATKAYTIGRRGAFKDYVDLYFIISKNYSDLNEIIKAADKKYGEEFNSRLFLEQLIYLEDIRDEEIIFLREKVEKETLKDFFESQIKKIEL